MQAYVSAHRCGSAELPLKMSCQARRITPSITVGLAVSVPSGLPSLVWACRYTNLMALEAASPMTRDIFFLPLFVEAMSAFDLERKIHLPKGNIFHGDLTWPFTDNEEQVGAWGVETGYDNIYLCGSAAKRGGAVSSIPGHNAAMKVLEKNGRNH